MSTINSNTNLYMNIGNGLALMLGLPTLNSWETEKRPADAKRGTLGFNTQTESLEFYNGSYWLTAKLQQHK